MRLLASLLAAAGVCAATAVIAASTPAGMWKASDGKTSVEISRCGASYCAAPAGGQNPVVFSQTGSSGGWQGETVNPQGGTFRDITMKVANDSELVLKGCLAVFCVEQVYTRTN